MSMMSSQISSFKPPLLKDILLMDNQFINSKVHLILTLHDFPEKQPPWLKSYLLNHMNENQMVCKSMFTNFRNG